MIYEKIKKDLKVVLNFICICIDKLAYFLSKLIYRFFKLYFFIKLQLYFYLVYFIFLKLNRPIKLSYPKFKILFYFYIYILIFFFIDSLLKKKKGELANPKQLFKNRKKKLQLSLSNIFYESINYILITSCNIFIYNAMSRKRKDTYIFMNYS